jgi:hypothetical protein
MQVIVHDRATAATRGQALEERLQPVFDPLLAVFKLLAVKERLVAIGESKKGKNISWQ